MDKIDLRSDTVGSPTREMLESILTAELGDDGRTFRDPTVVKLEELAAKKTGKEAGLLVPSGTMGNSVSVLANTKRGNEVVLDRSSHILTSEHAFPLVIGGLFPVSIPSKMGYMDPEDVRGSIKRKGLIRTGLICLENTHNAAGGIALSQEQMESHWDVAQDNDVPLHLDGARIFNAAIYFGIDVKKLTSYTDSLTFCLSKGMCAPIGSVVCGTEEFITKARHYRGLLGGRMRQAGIIAAPGIIALTKMVDRMKDDHAMARFLGDGIKEIRGLRLLHEVQTNIVRMDVSGLGLNAEQFVDEAYKHDILVESKGYNVIRLVTHRDIGRAEVERTLECLKKIAER